MTALPPIVASALRRTSSALGRLESIALGALFVFMLVFGLASVVARYLLFTTLPWPEEVNRNALIWLTFLGASIATRTRTDIRFQTNFIALIPPHFHRFADAAVDLVSIAFLLALAYFGWQFVMLVGDGTLITLRSVPIGVFIAAVPIMSVVMALHIAVAAILRFAERPLETPR